VNTEHGDHIMRSIAAAGGFVIALAVAGFIVLAWLERRRERVRLAEADAVLLPAAADIAERTVEEIAQDGLTDEQRADAARDARIAAWEHDAGLFRRRDLATMSEYTTVIDRVYTSLARDMLAVYDDGALAAEGFGFPVQRDRARMAALYERAHTAEEIREMVARPLATTVDATDTHEWSDEEIAEFQAMLAVGQAELDAERAAVTA